MPKQKSKLPPRDKINRKLRRAQAAGASVPIPPALQLVPDFGPPERWQHSARTLFVDEEDKSVAARALEECVLDSLRVAAVISPAFYTAGMKLRRDYTRAALAPRQVGKYGGTGEKLLYRQFVHSVYEEEAYQEWRTALLAAGVHYSDLLVNVCCLGWPPARADIPRLRDGLERLYAHYRATMAATVRPVI